MKKNIKVLIPVILAVVLVFAIVIIRASYNSAPFVEADEIKVNIKFDLNEDIGLLLINYNVNGADGTGGISHADKSMLNKNSKDLYWSFYERQLDTPVDTADVTLDFVAVTKFFTPNYDNIYPEECMVPMGGITFSAGFGKIYYVTITGSQFTGYQVVIDETKEI